MFKLWKGLAHARGSIKARNIIMNKDPKDCCYEEMTKGIGGQSIPSEYWHEPMQNDYEAKKWNSNGYDQSGMKGK